MLPAHCRVAATLNDSWKTAPNYSRPATCVVEADIDAEDRPKHDPQRTLSDPADRCRVKTILKLSDGTRIMPLGTNAANHAAGSLAVARPLVVPDCQLGLRGKMTPFGHQGFIGAMVRLQSRTYIARQVQSRADTVLAVSAC
jgi:hypothetical protein